MITLIWIAAIVGFALSGWVPGLLGLIAFLMLELGMDVKHAKQAQAEWLRREDEAARAMVDATMARLMPKVSTTLDPARYRPTVEDRAFALMCDASDSPIYVADTAAGPQGASLDADQERA